MKCRTICLILCAISCLLMVHVGRAMEEQNGPEERSDAAALNQIQELTRLARVGASGAYSWTRRGLGAAAGYVWNNIKFAEPNEPNEQHVQNDAQLPVPDPGVPVAPHNPQAPDPAPQQPQHPQPDNQQPPVDIVVPAPANPQQPNNAQPDNQQQDNNPVVQPQNQPPVVDNQGHDQNQPQQLNNQQPPVNNVPAPVDLQQPQPGNNNPPAQPVPPAQDNSWRVWISAAIMSPTVIVGGLVVAWLVYLKCNKSLYQKTESALIQFQLKIMHVCAALKQNKPIDPASILKAFNSYLTYMKKLDEPLKRALTRRVELFVEAVEKAQDKLPDEIADIITPSFKQLVNYIEQTCLPYIREQISQQTTGKKSGWQYHLKEWYQQYAQKVSRFFSAE